MSYTIVDVTPDTPEWEQERICAADGCAKPSRSRGYCNLHYQRVLRYGDPGVYFGRTGRPVAGEYPTFIAIHARLRRTKGPAKNHRCIDCGAQAKEWSYNNSDPHAVMGKSGKFDVAYSLDIENYDPRCIPCHRRFDFEERKGLAQ